MKKTLLGLLFLIANFCSSAQIKSNDCYRLKHIKLHYLDSQSTDSYVEIDDNMHTEYFNDKGSYIKSKLVWVNDCEYNAKIIEINIPGDPFKIGDELNVKIVKIENNIIDMVCKFKGEILKAQYEIIEYL